jgi:hypothetical protein
VKKIQGVLIQTQSPNSNTASNYDVFISYNTADVEFAELLAKRIEEEPYGDRQLKCFFATWDIEAGENILLRIENALSNSRFVAMIVSPDWLKSDWTTLERIIPVFEDPAGLKGRIIPILRRNCDIPPSIRILKWLDFRNDQNFGREIKKLLAKLTGKSYRSILDSENAGGISVSLPMDSVAPEKQEEILASNLFQLLQMPEFVNMARAKVKKRDDVWEMLGEVSLPIFALREDTQQIFSFAPLNNPQQKISAILQEPSTERISVAKMLSSSQYSVIIEILNRAMTEHMKSIGMVYDWKNKKTFFPLEKDGDENRYAKWRIGNREFTRRIVTKSKSGKYYAHRFCKATFTKFSDSVFLKILPGWHFTYDGLFQAVSPNMMKSLSTKWMNIERNHTVLDDVRFWASKLSGGKDTIKLDVRSDTPVVIKTTPVLVTTNRGIEEDYRERLWFEEEPSQDEVEAIVEQTLGETEEPEEEEDYE